jgi:hypothetical protein
LRFGPKPSVLGNQSGRAVFDDNGFREKRVFLPAAFSKEIREAGVVAGL